jgi:hypothetical protein
LKEVEAKMFGEDEIGPNFEDIEEAPRSLKD